jgi:glutaredoxin-like YruB-family protein
MQKITSLQDVKRSSSDYYVFIYKSDSELSNCAFDNLKEAIGSMEVEIYTADVNETKEIHKALGVTSAPTLVQMSQDKVVHLIKGCQNSSFYSTLFSGKSFTSFGRSYDGGSNSVVMYTTPTCTYCNSLKAYLNDKKVSFTEIDVSKDQQAAEDMVKRSGQQGVPQTVINGQVVIGFDRNKINQLLNIE